VTPTFVSAGWPYLYEVPGLHNTVPMLFADVTARRRRMLGEDVFYACGADEHGPRVEFVAESRGTTPRALVDEKVAATVPLLARIGLSLDAFGRTSSPSHRRFVSEFVGRLLALGAVERRTVDVPYCAACERHLPDRFTEGRCPRCGGAAFGNQCNDKLACGAVLEPFELVDGRCAVCASRFRAAPREHLFLPFAPWRRALRDHVEQSHAREPAVRERALTTLASVEGMLLTRDAVWGAPLPEAACLPGRTVYSWVDSLLGKVTVTGDRADALWRAPGVRKLFFLGPDSVDFYAVLLPALLLASRQDYLLDGFRVVTNDVLLYEGSVCSKSSRTGIWLPEALAVLPGDYWRFAVLAAEADVARRGDRRTGTDFRWDGFAAEVNLRLGALADRVGSLAGSAPAQREPEGGDALDGVRDDLDQLRPGAAFAALLDVLDGPARTDPAVLAAAVPLLECFLPATAERAQALLSGRARGPLLPELPLDGAALRREYDRRVAERRAALPLDAELADVRADALCVCPAQLGEG
jgi:methionyl-tRNA synthetase